MNMNTDRLLSFAKGRDLENGSSYLLVLGSDDHGRPKLLNGFRIPAEIKPPKTIVVRTPGLQVSEEDISKFIDQQIRLL